MSIELVAEGTAVPLVRFRRNGSCVCVSLWIEKAVEVRYVHDCKRRAPSSP